MLRDQDIICISSIDWEFIWQGHQVIMSSLADHGNRVLFIENTGVRPPNLKDLPRLKRRLYNWFHSTKGIRKERENLYIYSPLILPFPYSRIARWVNRHLLTATLERWVRSVGFSNPIVWTFLPTGIALDIIGSIDSKVTIYYCIDNFAASSPVAKRIRETERELLRKVDLVFVTAKNLYEWCSQYNENVHIFPFGVDMDVYEKARDGRPEPPEDIASIRHPIVGYVGGVHKWIDIDLAQFLAESHPDKSFVFVGPLQTDVRRLQALPNTHFLGQKRYEELPRYVAHFDVCAIPYLITEYTKNVYPTKLNEYLTLGKPVVSTAIPEVEAFSERNGNIVYIGRSKEEFSSLIEQAAKAATTPELYEKRISVASREGSWREKIEKMCELIEKKISAKEEERALHWKDNILRFYRKSERGIASSIVALLVIYLALFHTPLLWWVAKPLKLSSPLEKADAIVVLAGGVGESGKAGQGFEERVKYGVELFKEGYARHFIFSSGYTYAFKEAEVMKVLAVSLGVPGSSILLETNAKNTYENIEFSCIFLRLRNYKSAILISSPYHMRRVSLVCRKRAPDIHFAYAPIPHSIFYGNERSVELKHIVAIAHEYLGILYYWWKGYA
jgi:uncharacterized SAM-binding protein YcdF (DUF218 family)